MSDPQDVHHGSSVDPVESETNQNNADSFSPTPSSGPIDEQQVWAGRGDVTGGDEVRVGVDVQERGDVMGGDEVSVVVDVTELNSYERQHIFFFS